MAFNYELEIEKLREQLNRFVDDRIERRLPPGSPASLNVEDRIRLAELERQIEAVTLAVERRLIMIENRLTALESRTLPTRRPLRTVIPTR